MDDPNGKQTIWKYLDFTKFVMMLEKQALFFARADSFVDPFEGAYPKTNGQLKTLLHKKLPPELQKKFSEEEITPELIKQWIFISSWHQNEHESAAMWGLFAKNEEGIAIKSTFANLQHSLEGCQEASLHFGTIHYIDYEDQHVPVDSIYYPFLRKRKSFEHEREIRALIFKPDYMESDKFSYGGLNVPISIDTLVDTVYVSPAAPLWFTDLVKSIVKKYSLKKEVVQSSILTGPIV